MVQHSSSRHMALWFGGAIVFFHIVSAMIICNVGENQDQTQGKSEATTDTIINNRKHAAYLSAAAAAVAATAVIISGMHKASGIWCQIGCGVAIGLVLADAFYTLWLHSPSPYTQQNKKGKGPWSFTDGFRLKHHEVMKLYAKMSKTEGDDEALDTYYNKTRTILFVHGVISTLAFVAFLRVQ